ncbi:hypothetical protein [Streptomyces sp. NPDC006739]|uniref:hypothetical protein n=1 Tax=Streptomyces sp. NPDC006739 TaxID=3364763 RepID=UPI0036BC148F
MSSTWRWTTGIAAPGTVLEGGAVEPGSSALGGSADSGAPRPPRTRAPSGAFCAPLSCRRGVSATLSAWRWTTGSVGPGEVPELGAVEPGSSGLGDSADSGAPRPPRTRAPPEAAGSVPCAPTTSEPSA